MIERVVELEELDRVYYILYLVVICKEVIMIKFRVVYDVLLKLGKGGVLFNGCLYKGLFFIFLLFDILVRF